MLKIRAAYCSLPFLIAGLFQCWVSDVAEGVFPLLPIAFVGAALAAVPSATGEWIVLSDLMHSTFLADLTRKSSGELTRDGDVFELSDVTYKQFIQEHPNLLLLFYAPWCHWCTELLPKFKAAATLLQGNLNVTSAQVDATRWSEVADEFDVRGFPTIYLVLDGSPHEFDGGRTTADIVKWVTEHLNTEVVLNTKGDLETLLEVHKSHAVLIARFDNSTASGREAREMFVRESRKLENVAFAEVPMGPNEVVTHLLEHLRLGTDRSLVTNGSKPFLMLINPHHRDHPDSEISSVFYDGLPLTTDDGIAQFERFVKTYRFPLISSFTTASAPDLFGDGRPLLVLFSSPKNPEHDRILSVLQSVAPEFRNSLLFIHSGSDTPAENRLMSLLGADGETLPTMRLFRANPLGHGTWHSTLKYRPDDMVLERFDRREIKDFIHAFLNDKLEPYVHSEPVPDPEDEKDALIKTLVAKQFRELVEQSSKDLLVDFYAPWCGHCRKLEPVLQKVAEAVKAKDSPAKNIEIMKMDATRNEVNILLLGYPTLMLFTGRPHERQRHTFTGERTVEEIMSFLAEYAAEPFDAQAVIQQLAAREEHEPSFSMDKWLVEEL